MNANLTPASRRQDHTTSPSASAPFVKSTNRVHRIPSRVRDDREPPLVGTRRRGYNFDLGQIGNGMFFEMGLDSPNHVDPVQQIRPCAQLAYPGWSEPRPGSDGGSSRHWEPTGCAKHARLQPPRINPCLREAIDCNPNDLTPFGAR